MTFYLKLVPLLLLVSCATKYILPGNRFITPESQGGLFESQAEVQQTSATLVNIDGSAGTVDNGLLYSDTQRTGFLLSSSILDSLDLYWSHTGGAPSFLGGKFQIFGGSRTSKSAGHKLAVSAAFGGNEHELEGEPKIEFKLTGQDFGVMHGYRFNEFILLYDALAYSTFKFDGKVSSASSGLNGAKPSFNNKLLGLYVGTELSYGSFFGKLEYGYQMIDSTDTKKRSAGVLGYSLGFTW